jgi:hypothetical protein
METVSARSEATAAAISDSIPVVTADIALPRFGMALGVSVD